MDGHSPGDVGTTDVQCPRCGYRQEGQIQCWKDRCPLEGTCSECGLVFRWAEVLRPERFAPKWCVEFAPDGQVLRACVRTFLMSVRPWLFWRRVQMSQSVRWRRLGAYAAFLILPAILVLVAVQSIMAVSTYQNINHAVLQEYQRYVYELPQEWQRKYGVTVDLNASDVEFEQQTDALVKAILESGDRGWGDLRMEAMIVGHQVRTARDIIGAPIGPTISMAHAVVEAVFTPWRGVSAGVIQAPLRNVPYIAPRDLWVEAEWMTGPRVRGNPLFDRFTPALLTFAIFHLLLVMIPASFILLPMSRRRAKVRWVHVGRAFVYGLVVPLYCIVAMALLLAIGNIMPPLRNAAIGGVLLLCYIGLPLLLCVWLTAVIGRYMRIPRAPFVAMMLIAMCLLLIVAAFSDVWMPLAIDSY